MTSLAAAAELFQPLLYEFLLTFCRVGAAFFMFPAFTDHVPQQARLLAALAVSLPVSLVAGSGQAFSGDPSGTVLAVLTNVTLGAYFGLSARLILAAMQMAGQLMGQFSGLYNPFAVGGLAFEGSTVISSIMVLGGTAIIFAADLHVHFIAAVAGSFNTVSLHGEIDPAVLSMGITEAVSTAFALAVQFAAPFIVLGFVFNLAMGVCNRMMPALPVYFVFSPVVMFLGVFLIVIVLAAVSARFSAEMAAAISSM